MTDLSGAGVRVLLMATATHTGPTLPSVPAAGRGLMDLRAAFLQRCGVSPDNLRTEPDLADARTMAEIVTEEAQRADTVLLVYFIGHGLLGPGEELFLAAKDTDQLVPGMADHQALSFSSLRQALSASRAFAVVIVLDCCFSGRPSLDGRAPDVMSALEPAHGTYLIGSAEQLAHAPTGAKHTAFTGAFLDVLENGDPRGPHMLTLDAVYDAVDRQLRDQHRPWPRRRAENRAGKLVIAANPAMATDLRPDQEDPAPGRCPYPGLGAFGTEDADVFFGRARMTDRVLAAIAGADGPVVLVGPSGSGKTSLLNAGLFAGLRHGGLPGLPRSAGWPCLRLTPASNPLRRLAEQLCAPDSVDLLRKNPHHAAELVDVFLTDRPGQKLIILVDQLEELFTLCLDPTERTAFLRALSAIAESAHGLVVLAIRADFYGHATEHPELLGALRDRQLLVEPLTREELRATIEQPAAAVGLTLDDGLADVILHELGMATGTLPLLSHALWATWRERSGTRLTFTGYRATGGISSAIATTADQVYLALDELGKDAVRRILLRLVRVGEEDTDTARPVDRTVLLHDLPDAGAAQEALDLLARARLVTLDRDTARISHEALLREWPQLRKWINSDRDWLHLRQQLDDDAVAWERADRDPSLLYRGNRLAGARARIPAGAIGLPPAVKAFLSASERVELRQRRQSQAVRAGLVLLTVVALVALGFAQNNADQARRNADAAGAQHNIALSRQLAAQSLAVDASNPRVARQLAAAAWHISPTEQAQTAMSTLLSRKEQNGMLIGHRSDVEGLAFNPAGTVLASVDGLQVRLWNPENGEQIGAPLDDPGDGLIEAVAFNPRGTALAVSADSGTVWLLDPTTRREIARAEPPDKDVHDGDAALAFSPNGKLLATADGPWVRLWNSADLRKIGAPLRGAESNKKVTAVTFNPGGTVLTTAATDGAIRFWNPATGREIGQRITVSKGVVRLASNPSGSILATANGDGTVGLWDPHTHRAIGAPLAVHPTGEVSDVVFSPDGTTLATLASGLVQFWDVATRKEIGNFISLEQSALPNGLAFNPAGTMLAAAAGDNTVRLYNPATRRPIGAPLIAGTFGYQATAAVINPQGTILATSDSRGTVELWNPEIQQRYGVRFAANTRYAVTELAFNPNGTLLATAGTEGIVRLWDPNSRQGTGPPIVIPAIRGGPDGFHGVEGVAFSADGAILAAAYGDGTVRLWNPGTGKAIGDPIVAFPLPAGKESGEVRAVAFNPSGTVLATAGEDGVVRLWDPATQRQLGADIRLPNSGVSDLAFDPTGRMLATAGSNDSKVYLWDPATQRTIGEPITTARVVTRLAFSPSGDVLATADFQTVRLWNPDTRKELGFPINVTSSGAIFDLDFTPTGERLITVINSGAVTLWRTDRWIDPYRTLCAEVGPIDWLDWAKYAWGEPHPDVCT
ncbi:caspase, EACC1-associated type [Micromonospora zhanjiangensis]|uniref:Caspase family protein n=1 Tax=Micromonospora zhanjiangensis TaxID=1522057 RepID=A0ABV8KX16_9ACTN